MSKPVFVSVLALGLAVSGTALAQSSTGPSGGSANSQANASSANQGRNVLTVSKVKQDLESAGFTNVQVLADVFVVQAKNKDGNPVVTMIGPNSVTAFEAIHPQGASAGSAGTTGSTGSAGSGPQHK